MVGAGTGVALCVAVIGASVLVERQPPRNPCFTHVIESVLAVVIKGMAVEVKAMVDVERHPPNHPYWMQVVVGTSDVDIEVLVELAVVVSSRQPAKVSERSLGANELEKVHTPPSRRLASHCPCL